MFTADPPACPRCGAPLGSCQHHHISAEWSRAIGLFGTRDLAWHATSQTWIPRR
jgi:hypothetical protein